MKGSQKSKYVILRIEWGLDGTTSQRTHNRYTKRIHTFAKFARRCSRVIEIFNKINI